MAAKKRVANQPKTIRLKYNVDNQTVTSTPRSPVHLEKNDLVRFVSGRDKVYVKLNPKAYQPSEFTPDSGPVKVIAAPNGEKSAAQCGIVKKINGKEVAYGWVPGVGNRIRLSNGIETEP
jgi:hypothetical protein